MLSDTAQIIRHSAPSLDLAAAATRLAPALAGNADNRPKAFRHARHSALQHPVLGAGHLVAHPFHRLAGGMARRVSTRPHLLENHAELRRGRKEPRATNSIARSLAHHPPRCGSLLDRLSRPQPRW